MFKKLKLDIHPIFIAAYPSLSLLAVNIGQVDWHVILRPLVVSIILTISLLILFRFLLGSMTLSGLITSLTVTLFFSYGHVYSLVENTNFLGLNIGRHRYLFPIWLTLGLLIALFLLRQKPGRTSIRALNLATFVLVAFPIISLISFGVKSEIIPSNTLQGFDSLNSTLPASVKDQPTIYYIILDEYPRQDILLKEYDFDNSGFIQHLEELGFYVAGRSMSNYAHTDLSLASSLNIDYLQSLVVDLDPSSDSREINWELIQNNTVRSYLEERGYLIAAFETGYAWSQWEDADYYSGPAQGYLTRVSLSKNITDFEVLFIRQTAILFVEDIANIFPGLGIPRIERRSITSFEQVTYILEELPVFATLEDSTFVFAHLLVPHPPYTYSISGDYIGDQILQEYGARGEDLLYNHNVEGHRRSVEFITTRILEVIDNILKNAEHEPIIILQADTGPPGSSREDRMSILYALYLADYGDGNLDETISPVNTFRVIFNSIFDEGLVLLDNIAYYSAYNEPYDFAIIPNK